MFSDECDDDQSINEAEVFKVALVAKSTGPGWMMMIK